MGALVQVAFLVSLGLCAAMAGCGALVLVIQLPRLVSRQRATLFGVGR